MTTTTDSLTRDDVQEIVRNEVSTLREEMREHYATKADLAKLEANLTWKLSGLQIASMVGVAAILRFLS